MEIKYKGKKYQFEQGISLNDIIKKLKLDHLKILVGSVNGKLVDLYFKVNEDSEVEFYTFADDIGKQVFWHSSAHVLAAAVKNLYPEAMLGIGPAIDEGFYYDFYNVKIESEDLKRIEDEMYRLTKKGLGFERIELTKDEASKLFSKEKFKLELLNDIDNPSAYKTGNFIDLCRGPHIPSSSMIKAIKLLRIAGAYWKGDSKREVMTRIYGISFPSKDEMDEYLKFLAEKEKHDHKVIGKDLELFMLSDLMPGTPLYLPNGTIIYNQLLSFARELDNKHGYKEVITPFIAKSTLWEISGHLAKYRKNMYKVTPFDKEDEEYVLKPMNCPFHILIFKSKPRSYKDLPLRISEFGIVHRYELEGALDGLLRTRVLQQNDAHVFLMEDQIEKECDDMIDMALTVYRTFNLKPMFVLATRPEERIGSDELWDIAENALKNVLEHRKIPYVLKEGDGAFYGPKIDIYVADFTGKFDQTYAASTIQLDFNLPQRFGIKYTGKDNAEHTPVMIHRALMGSIGRFMGIILSNSGGDLPLWLSPVQAIVLPISEKYTQYANEVSNKLSDASIRNEVDDKNTTLDYKIRSAQMRRIPYILVVGEKEEKQGKIAVRDKSGKTSYNVDIDKFISTIKKEIEERSLTPLFRSQ